MPLVFLDAARRFGAKGGWMMSSHVAMSLMMALFPFMLFLVAVAGEVTSDVDVDALVDLIFAGWPDSVSAPLETEIRAVLAQDRGRLMSIGALLALFFASNGVDALRKALTQAYRGTDPRPFWQHRLVCVIFVIGGAILIVAVAAIGVAIPLYLQFIDDAAPGIYRILFGNDVIRLLLGLGLMAAMVFACHIWLPGHRDSETSIWPGALLTLGLWIAAGQAFSIYVSRFASYSATYAGLAGAMSALIFLYLMAAILIFGAEVNGSLERRRLGALAQPEAD